MIKYHHQFWEDYAGCWYEFEQAGDAIPSHAHDPELRHDVTVYSGSVRVNDTLVSKGITFKFDSSKPHEIVALEPNTKTLHVYEIFPQAYLKLPKEDLRGEIA